MKRSFTTAITLLAAILAAPGSSFAQSDTASTLKVDLTGLEAKGTVRMAVFDSEEMYEGGAPVTGANVTISAETATVSFELPAGTYAIKLYHDVNDNGEMDTNPFGMPTEPYAFSNNAKGNFGPAKWDKAAFELGSEPVTQTLSVN